MPILAPFWPLIRGIVDSRGAVPMEVPFHDHPDRAGFDAEAALEAAAGPRTAAIYVNSPNKPTGRVMPRGGEIVVPHGRIVPHLAEHTA